MAKDIKFLKADLQKFIESIVTKQMKLEWAQLVADTIYKRTKSGKGLTQNKVSIGGNSLKKIEELSPAYTQYRARRILGPFASPKRSNLTLSGELLESIIAKMRGNDAIVEIEDVMHGSGINMRELAGHVSDKGRPFFGLADNEAKTLENYVKRKIRDKIRTLIKR